jgi:hypothetical protein
MAIVLASTEALLICVNVLMHVVSLVVSPFPQSRDSLLMAPVNLAHAPVSSIPNLLLPPVDVIMP